MQQILGTKLRLKTPRREQLIQLDIDFGCARYVYNHFLKLCTRYYRRYAVGIKYKFASRHLTKLRTRKNWLRHGSRTAQTQSLRHLFAAFSRFFKKTGKYPSYKSKYTVQKCSYQDSRIEIDSNRIYISNVGWFEVVKNKRYHQRLREIRQQPDSIVLTRDRAGAYYASFCTIKEVISYKKTNKIIGIDMGLSHFLTDSNQNKIENQRYLRNRLKALRRSQKALSRKVKTSRRREKNRRKIALLHKRVTDLRQNFCHQLSTQIVRYNDMIFAEDLAVANMTRNRKLSRAIADAGWANFLNMLEYKAKIHDRVFMKIGRFDPSSKTCSKCFVKNEDLKLRDRSWTCHNCHAVHDRDVNAAANILRWGLQKYSTGGTGDVKKNAETKEDLDSRHLSVKRLSLNTKTGWDGTIRSKVRSEC